MTPQVGGCEDRVLDNTVEVIPTLGALFPRGGPVQDPVLTEGARERVCVCQLKK